MSKSELQLDNLPNYFNGLRDNLTGEILGFGLFMVGGVLLFSLPGNDSVAWLVQMTGWTAPLVALSVMATGVVLMLRKHAGYWSAEALVGAEMLLLGLMAGTFVIFNPYFTWSVHPDGSYGGIVGSTIGGFLVAAFGQLAAFFLVSVLSVIGIVFLVRYTPLIYLSAYASRAALIIQAHWERLAWPDSAGNRRNSQTDWPPAPDYSQNFVTPDAPVIQNPAGHEQKRKTSRRTGTAGKREKTKRAASTAVVAQDLPPLDYLDADSGNYGGTDVRALEQAIEQTLEDFNVPVRVVHVESGPTVTQFGVEPLYLERSGQRRKVRVNRIVNLADDLALALAARAVRIEAPVPGRPYVGIEVPNSTKTLVSLRGILESSAMQQRGTHLQLGLGRDTSGAAIILDLVKAPHLLIAGATGSGKSVCINSIITSLLMQHGPESLRFVMVDPKMVELPGYNGVPHLLGKVITDVTEVMGAVTWLLLQMDDRYRLFRELGVRNIDAYNQLARKRRRGKNALEHLPYIVLVVDELADLMMTAAEDIERQICRLAQMARATGIHLILATQRPSTDVVTGLIKANFPSRIAFAVTSQVDSRVILDTPGAERLLGRGDMLLMRPDASKLFRLQGCRVSDEEIERVVSFWKNQEDDNEPAPVPPWNGLLDRMDDDDEQLMDAIDLLREMDTCSTSMLQRRLRVGYPKAARLMEQLEARGVVGPDMGGGQGREVLLTDDEQGDSATIEEDIF